MIIYTKSDKLWFGKDNMNTFCLINVNWDNIAAILKGKLIYVIKSQALKTCAGKLKIETQLSLFLIMHQDVKAYGETEVYLHGILS
jgi:hypothetical protein